MDISIIIPAHNEEDCIAQTLDSLVNQSLRPKQVVIVNDNSTDGTKKIVEYYDNILDLVSINLGKNIFPAILRNHLPV